MVRAPEGDARDDRILAPTRWVAILIVPVLLAAFVILYGWPDRTRQLWAWTIAVPMSSLVMGAGYLAGAYMFFRVARSHEWHRVAIGFAGAALFATLLLIATVLHWDKFNHDHVCFWAWLLLYVATPLLLPWLWVENQRTDPGAPADGDAEVPRPFRLAVGVVGLAQLVFALAIMVRPKVVLSWWPWALTPLTARSLAAFLAFPAFTLAWFLVDRRWTSFLVPLETAAIGLAFVAVGTLRAARDFGGPGRLARAPYLGAVVTALAVLAGLRAWAGITLRDRAARELEA